MAKILFILKKNQDYSFSYSSNVTLGQLEAVTGLFHSCKFINDMLVRNNFVSKIAIVRDNNDIDRECAKFEPTHVIIEGLWVVPEKFIELKLLHPKIKWIVRIHSDMPFLANEGIAMDWIVKYFYQNVCVAANSERTTEQILKLAKLHVSHSPIHLPNCYPLDFTHKKYNDKKDVLDIGCFGAIRPMKNQLSQAHAAINLAMKLKKKLNFHINGNRTEMKGDQILKNLVGLFDKLSHWQFNLIQHDWLDRTSFLSLIKEMDIGMQVSFSETFNIVAADFIYCGVPVVCSNEIPWASSVFTANSNNINNMYKMLLRTHNHSWLNVAMNKRLLKDYSADSELTWLEYFREH